MNDDRHHPLSSPYGAEDPTTTAESEEPAAPAEAQVADRRRFLRQVSGDAVVTVGRLAGLSSMLGRSLSAAGGSVARDLTKLYEPTDPPDDDATARAMPDRVPAPDPIADQIAKPDPGEPHTPDPVERLTADHHAFLAASVSATLAINSPSGPPHLGTCHLAWDGTRFRMPSQLVGARATLVERDPRVSLLIEEHDTGSWVMVAGLATLNDAHSSDDTVVIAVRPTRFVWSLVGRD